MSGYPENSLRSLLEATKAGFGLELDIRLTKDKDFLIIHDDDFYRLSGRKGKVSETNIFEVANSHYMDGKTKFISLNFFLNTIKKLNIYPSCAAVHLKLDSQTTPGLKKIARYWRKYNMYINFFVFGLTPGSAFELKKIDNRIKIGLIVSDYKFEHASFFWEEVKNLNVFDIVWVAEYRHFYSDKLFSDIKKTRKKIFAVSPDIHKSLGHPLAYKGYEKTWQKLLKWKVDGICTDHPFELAQNI